MAMIESIHRVRQSRVRQSIGATLLLVMQWFMASSALLAAQPQEEFTSEQRDELLSERNDRWGEALELLKTGKPAEAIPLLKQVLDIEQPLLGPHHQEVITTLDKLASTYLQLEDYPSLIETRRQRLNALEQALRKGHWRLADARWDLKDAELLADMTPEERKAFHRADDLNRQGIAAQGRNELESALEMLRESLQIRQRLLEPPNPDLSTSLGNLGFLHVSMGEYSIARKYYEQALDMRELLYPEEECPDGHPNLVSSFTNLGSLSNKQGNSAGAKEFYQRAVTMSERLYPEEEYPQGQTDLARSLSNLGLLLMRNARYAEARLHLERALLIRERLFPAEKYPNGHVDLALSLNNLAFLMERLEEHIIAKGLYERALKMYELLYPEEQYPHGHPALADCIDNLGALYKNLGDYKDALALFKRGLEMRQRIYTRDKYPRGHRDLSVSLNNLGSVLNAMGDYAGAREYHEQALAMDENLFPTDEYPEGHIDLVIDLSNLGTLLHRQGEYVTAKAHFERALEMAQKLYPENRYPDGHPNLAYALNNLANVLESLNEYLAARPYFEQALAMRERIYSEELYPNGHSVIVTSLTNLGLLCYRQGEFTTAKVYLERALAMDERLHPKDDFPDGHPDLAATLGNLGSVLAELGNYSAAVEYQERALEMRERLFPTEVYPMGHSEISTSLTNLGVLFRTLGDLATAKAYFEKALAMDERLYQESEYPDGHPNLVIDLNNLGTLHEALDQFDLAKSHLERAIAMCERLYSADVFPAGHPSLSMSLNNLGTILESEGNYDDARPVYERALAMHQRLYPEEEFPDGHPNLVIDLNNLADLFFELRDFDTAREYSERALAMRERLYPVEEYPEGHPALALGHSNFALLALSTGQPREGLEHLTKAFWMDLHTSQDVFSGASQKTMHSFLHSSRQLIHLLLSAASLNEGDEDVTDTAMQAVLARKTILADTMLRFRAVERLQAQNPEIAAKALEFRAMRQQLADVMVQPLGETPPAERAAQLQALAEKSNQLQVELNRALSAAAGDPPPPKVDLQSLRSKLADDAVAVEFVHFQPFEFGPTPGYDKWQPGRYLAFVLHPNSELPVRMIDLGEAQPIDDAIAALREHIENIKRKLQFTGEEALEEEYVELAAELSQLIVAPLAEALGDAKTVYLSPDGELNRVAFEALVDAKGNYLVDKHRFAYVPSCRDLLRDRDEPSTGTIVFASPDYNLSNDANEAPPRLQLAQVQTEPAADEAFHGERSIDIRGLNWETLPATRTEAAQIEAMLNGNQNYGPVAIYMNAEANETQLKQLDAPRILHLATHGFYLADQQRELSDTPILDRSASTTTADLARLGNLENPLLRSGIILAGANRLGEQTTTDDGWVTAEEVGLLNLQGTQLVVLSACETGLGDIRTGEGVAGLRQAFLQAGAASLLTSLYKVPDDATQELMVDFYTRLSAGEGKLEAFHSAQQEVIRSRREEYGGAHPFFWASFILVGQPN